MTKALKSMGLLLVAFMLFNCLLLPAQASGGLIEFTVHPIIPANQRDESVNYFDLIVNAGDTQKIEIIVTNSSEREMIVDVEAASASTTGSGVIDYTGTDIKDDSLKHPFSEIASVSETTVKIPAGQERVVSAEVKVPEELFEGMILGSICITDITNRKTTEERKSDTQGFSVNIQNEYEYVTAVVLRESEKPVEPNYELGEVYAITENGRKIIVAEVRNTAPNLAKEISYSSAVTPVGSQEKLYAVADLEVSFAPNSVMSYKFRDSAMAEPSAGDYIFTGSITDGGKTWDFSKEFTVEKENSEKGTETAINQIQNALAKNDSKTLLILACGALLVIILIIMIVAAIMKKRKKR